MLPRRQSGPRRQRRGRGRRLGGRAEVLTSGGDTMAARAEWSSSAEAAAWAEWSSGADGATARAEDHGGKNRRRTASAAARAGCCVPPLPLDAVVPLPLDTGSILPQQPSEEEACDSRVSRQSGRIFAFPLRADPKWILALGPLLETVSEMQIHCGNLQMSLGSTISSLLETVLGIGKSHRVMRSGLRLGK